MPLEWRGMLMAEGQPEVGRGKKLLGVLVGPGEDDDIPEEDGKVKPGTGGMSVSPSVEWLPGHRIPRRLKARFPKASGPNTLHCWSLGDGSFESGPLAPGLDLRLDPDDPEHHATVEPAEEVPTADYEAAIIATAPMWLRFEE